MAIATIRPDGTITAGTSVSLVGAATAHAAISDQNNSTYIQRTGSAGTNYTLSRYSFANPSLSNCTVRSVKIYAYGFTHNFCYFGPNLSTNRNAYSTSGGLLQVAEGTTTPSWRDTGPQTTAPGTNGAPWSLTDVNNLELTISWEDHVLSSDISRFIEVYAEIDYARAPGTPTTGIIPAHNAGVSKPNPDLAATLVASGDGQKQRAEWQFATNTGFTTNVKSVLSASPGVVSGTVTANPTTTTLDLAAGTWYMRVRGVDEYGVTSAWSTTNTITVTHVTGAVNQTPTGDQTALYGATNTFTWVFSGPSSSSVQTAYQIVVERNDTGALVVDTGKVTSANKTANIALGIGSKDVPLRWKIQVWDGGNTTQGYSNWHLFRVSDAPIITITAPSAGGTATTGQPTVTWTLDGNTTQASRRVAFYKSSDSSLIFDSGTTATSSQTYTPPQKILTNATSYFVKVWVTDTVGLTGEKQNTFTTSYVVPNAVTYSVDPSTYEWDGYILVNWATMTPDASFTNWNVYRRLAGVGGEWTRLLSTGDVNTRQYKDYLATSGDYFEYAVTQTALRTGEYVEGDLNPSPIPILAASTHYWIIDPEDYSNSLRLDQVTDDSYSEPYDQAELVIIGRGRKMNLGTRHGYDGTLTVKLRDDARYTARQKRLKLQALRAANTAYYLRNPFGDTLLIVLGDLSFSRIAGVGTNEWVDVTVPYKEVY